MEDNEVVGATKGGFELLSMWARNIAMLPLEDWDVAFEKAEAIAPIAEPAIFQNYIYADKARIIRELVRAAIPLKKIVMDAQALCEKEAASEFGR